MDRLLEYKNKVISFNELIKGISKQDLVSLTNEMVDRMLEQIRTCQDEDVVFTPIDPEAMDDYGTDEEATMAWNLGHVIVHTTASSEESAFLAAELARGVEFHGRSRYELPWREMVTIAGCKKRLEDSRKMRLASLEIWPDPPHLDNTYEVWAGGRRVNAIGRFIMGLTHDIVHLGQIRDILEQVLAERQL